ncbi:MAG TPA: DUF2752 domain-containing protein [Polyangiaceae bacterium]|jgi:hypothetical protein|nr:DUF2752 domain-containing protein [Polyangiaceae bacterium]
MGSRARRWSIVALGAILCGLVVASDVYLCPFAAVTGLPCPGCGLTRATLALVHGDLTAALRLHPLSPIIAPLGAFLGLEAVWSYLQQKPPTWSAALLRRLRIRADWLWGALALVLIGVWGIRFTGALGGPVSVVSAWR